MGSPRSLSLVQFYFPSTLTQLAQSFTLTVVLTTISTPMTLSYTYHSHLQIFLTLYKNCLNDIQNFMFTNKLKLNPEKTEFILIGSKYNHKQLLPHFPINILGNQVSPAQSVRNLGVVFDSNFSFSDHVSQVIKSTRVHVRDLYRICPLLDLNTSVLLANALVSSRLDYCNSLFLSLTDFKLRRLQLVQNSLCRSHPFL